MNKPAARKLIRHLMKQQQSEAAGRFNIKYWGSPIQDVYSYGGRQSVLAEPICNTQACMAGETVLALGGGFIIKGKGGIRLYSKYRVKELDIEDTAAKLLGLTIIEAQRLFYFKSMRYYDGWPAKYEQQYVDAKTPAARLGVAIRRLAHFIVTDGLE